MMRVCLDCRPGLRSLPGVQLSHGYCTRHGLELLERENLIYPGERFHLFLLRRAPLIWVIIGAVIFGIVIVRISR